MEYPFDDVIDYVHYKFCFNETGEEFNIICNINIKILIEK